MPPRAAWQRQEVRDMTAKWQLIRDCLAGEEAIKGPNQKKYLPVPAQEEDIAKTNERYDNYCTRAVFYNVTARTLGGLVGQVYSKAPTIDLPAELEFLKLDINGSGISLEQQSKKVLRNILSLGRAGLLTDYPKTNAEVTKAELAAGYIRPQIIQYDAEQIINWRVIAVGGKILLKLLVLERTIDDESDDFEIKKIKEWRIYRRSNAGVVTVEIITENMNTQTSTGPTQVTDHTGKAFDEIPFVFIGVENNDPEVDLPTLYDLAILNIGHYRNSADFEESSFMVGQPTLWMSGVTETWVTNVFKGSVRVGSRGGIPLPIGGAAGLLQAQPNSLPAAGMQEKEQQMVALGARLVQMKQVQRTATEASQDKVSEVSILASAARNTSAAYTAAFRYAAKFLGSDASTVVFELTTDYELSRLTPQEQLQLVASWQAGAITDSEMRYSMRQGGIARTDDKTWETETKETRDRANKALEGTQLPTATKPKTPAPKA